jgi:hypothetical protein
MSWAYPSTGLATPLDDILPVLGDIMRDGEAPDGQLAMAHLQCFLGYGLTGHTSSQVCFWRELPIMVSFKNNSTKESHRRPEPQHLARFSVKNASSLHLAPDGRATMDDLQCLPGAGLERDTYYGFIQKKFYYLGIPSLHDSFHNSLAQNHLLAQTCRYWGSYTATGAQARASSWPC